MLHGADLTEARAHAEALAQAEGLTFIHPFDNEHVMAGQGTMALEILEQTPDVEAIVVPVGGGGLLAGIGTVMKARKPSVRVIGVEPEHAACLTAALAAGAPVTVPLATTLADGLAVALLGTRPFATLKEVVDKVVTVDEASIALAILRLIKMVCDAGKSYRVPVSMCGEMAADPMATLVLLGLIALLATVVPQDSHDRLELWKMLVERGHPGEPPQPPRTTNLTPLQDMYAGAPTVQVVSFNPPAGEFTLIPMALLIGIWGSSNRVRAAVKFFLYTFAGSVFMLLGIIALYLLQPANARTFDIATLQQKLTDAGLADRVTFVLMNVFGRTLRNQGADKGRDHNLNHHVMSICGKHVRGGVSGGIEESGNDFGATSIDSVTGAKGGDIIPEQTLESAAKTLGRVLGIPQERLDERIAVGTPILSAIAG